ncbi:YidB family protein [uncultured Methylobacterium sp.]|uniref:YidB family protein n=1 Tax=uncultured Methylobacterium sp. TaxID=157278 RepID=UPI0025845719|nr:YidB family protein [uncultured Methylobacterium sp.]
MSKGYPSMTALLGLLAVAGYQNRDKLAEWLGGPDRDLHRSSVPPVPQARPAPGATLPAGLERVLGGVGSAGVGGLLASGLSELVEHFTHGGHGATARSWVDQGANQAIAEADLERAIGPTTLDHLIHQTGLSRSEILARLSRDLPSAIDRYAIDGRRLG